MKASMKRFPRVYLWLLGIVTVIILLWFSIRTPKTELENTTDAKSMSIEHQFKLRDNFTIQLIAAEPDIINPMTMSVDEHGAIYVSESSTYRYGIEGAPSKNVINPIKRVELNSEGYPTLITVVAEGFANPVMGIYVYEDKLYATCLNELFVMDIGADGKLTNRKILVKDAAVPWNPFGMYRVVIGPDAKIWLAIADHPDSKPVTLTGSDGRTVRLRGQSGGFVRCNLDGSGLEVAVQGFRAPFAFDIDPWGHLWAVSNGEGSPNIYVNVIPGMDYGYHSRNVSYAWLAGKTTLAPPVYEMGPGANTVAIHYYNSMFPDDFWGAIFMANWGSHGAYPTNRKVQQFLRQEDGKEVTGTAKDGLIESPQPFLTSTDSLFRPVCMVSAPDGGLYLADWNGHDDESNNTGRIFKIIYTGKKKSTGETAPTANKIKQMNPGELCGLLGNQNHFIRELAQRTLVQSGAAALEPLGQVMKNGNAFATANAIWTLTRISSIAATQIMSLALKHPDERVRALALRQLRQAAGQQFGSIHYTSFVTGGAEFKPSHLLSLEALAKLAEPLVRDEGGEVRVEAALALNSSEAISEGLLTALEIVTDKRLRYQIGFELGRYGNLASLKKLYADPNPDIHKVALIAAETARNEKSNIAASIKDWGLTLADQDLAGKLLGQIQKGKANLTASEQLMALEWLEQHPTIPSKPLLEFLLLSLQNGDHLVQAAALRTLRLNAILHSPDIKSTILSILHNTKGPVLSYNQLEALYTLGSFADIGRPEEWLPWLKDSSKVVVTAALRALREQGRKPEFMRAIWPTALAAAQRNPLLAEEVWDTFQKLDIPEAQVGKLPVRPVRSADKNQFAKLILSNLKGASSQRGKWSFTTKCSSCHSARSGEGELLLGPNLANIGVASQPQYLIESILQPSKVLKTGFQVETLETKDGQTFSGQMETRDQKIIIKRRGTESLKIPMTNVKRRTTSHISPMPEGLDNTMPVSELADLTAYLLTLKGGD